MNPTIGRIVYFKLAEGDAPGKCVLRPAIITHVWNPTCINVRVFRDGSNDDLHMDADAEWRTSVLQGDGVGQWSWPPQAPLAPAYTPPPDLESQALDDLTKASSIDLERAAEFYRAYGEVTGGRSAVTGAPLPRFEACPPLVKAGWLAVPEATTGAPG